MPDPTQTNPSAPNPIAVPEGTNQTTPVAPAPNPHGLSAAQMATAAAGTPSPEQTIQKAQAAPGTLQTGAATGTTTAAPGQLPAAPTAFQAYTAPTAPPEIKPTQYIPPPAKPTAPEGQQAVWNEQTREWNFVMKQGLTTEQQAEVSAYKPLGTIYDPNTGLYTLGRQPNVPSVMNAENRNMIDRGLYGDDSGILSTDGYYQARSSLASAIDSAEASPLSEALSQSEQYAQGVINANIAEYERLTSFAAGKASDPMLDMLISRQKRLSEQMSSTVTDIHAQAEQSLKEQDKLNKQLEGKTRAAINAAGQVGSMVGEGYLAAQLQNNMDALSAIRASEQKAVTDARIAFENQQDDIAFKMVNIIEDRRQQANEILNKNFQITKDMESMKMQRQQFALQAKQQEMQMRREGKEAANDFLTSYAKQGLAPEAIPDTVWDTAVKESSGTISKETAKVLYSGSLKDQQAKDMKSFNENIKVFYDAASQIKDPGMTLYRPNMDGSFTSIKRSEIQTAPDYDIFEKTQGGKKYRVYLDKNNPEAKPLEIPIGREDSKTELREDMWGNTVAIKENDDGTYSSTVVIDVAGNPNGPSSIAETGSFIQSNADANGYNVTSHPDSVRTPPLGTLSAQYESSGDPGAIGYDSTGGWSYGTYQLAHNNALNFVKDSPYAAQFDGVKFNSPEFKDKWKQIAKQDPKGFERMQHDYIKKTHFDPQIEKLKKAGVDLSQYSPVLQDVIWSTAVQHGANTDVVAQAFQRLGKGAPENEVIKAIYGERWAGGRRFANSTADVKKGVERRFFGLNGEMSLALSRLQAMKTMPKDNAMAWHIEASEGAPIKTNIRSGVVETSEQVGMGANGKPMLRVVVRDLGTNTRQEFSGVQYSDLKEGMSWGESEPAPSIGMSSEGGYSQALANGDGSPMQPTGEIDIEKYGTWGRYQYIPPKAEANMDRIRNDVEAGKIDMDTAVRRVKSDPMLRQVQSSVTLDDLAGSYRYATEQRQALQQAKDEAAREKAQNKDYTQQDNLRKEAQSLPEVKEFKTTRDSYSIINSLTSNRAPDGSLSGAGDMSMIFAFMKMLDPGSTVREGEFANAENAGGVNAKIQNLYNKAIKGNRLTSEQVNDFVAQSNALYQSKLRQVQPTLDYYKGIAEKRGFDPNEILPDISYRADMSQNANLQSGQTWTDPTTGETFIIE